MNIMISYSRRDGAEVDAVLSELARYGLHAWKDTSNFKGGEDWRATLLKKPRSVDGFIPFLSKHYVDSPMCRMELFLARATDRNIFPIMLTECWGLLDTKEGTKYISALFLARMEALKIASLPA
jgi:TIR domain